MREIVISGSRDNYKVDEPSSSLRITTPILEAAKHTKPEYERLEPFAAPPWRRTPLDFGGRLLICGTEEKKKDEAAKVHCAKVQRIWQRNDHSQWIRIFVRQFCFNDCKFQLVRRDGCWRRHYDEKRHCHRHRDRQWHVNYNNSKWFTNRSSSIFVIFARGRSHGHTQE